MRRLTMMIVIVLIIFLVIFFTVYRGNVANILGRNDEPEIVLIMKSVSDEFEFWQMVDKGAQEAAKEFDANLTITGTISEEDVAGQIAIIDDIIKTQPDVVILAALDYEQLVEPAQRIKDAGIKLITLDSGLSEDISECFVGTDSYSGGKYLADKMNELLNGSGSVAMITHSVGSETAKTRTSGFAVGLIEHQNIKQFGETFNAKDDRNKAYEHVKTLLSRYGDRIDGIFATNQICSEGAGLALSESEYVDDIVMLAFDSSVMQNELLANGVINGLIVQQPFNMGYTGVKHAVELAKGGKLPAVDYIEFKYIDRDNMYEEENLKLIFPFLE